MAFDGPVVDLWLVWKIAQTANASDMQVIKPILVGLSMGKCSGFEIFIFHPNMQL